MVDYRIVKKCGLCRNTFVVNKGENYKRFCGKCQPIIDKSKD